MSTKLQVSKEVLYSTQIDSKVWQAVKGALNYTLLVYYTIAHALIGLVVCPQASILTVYGDVSKLEIGHPDTTTAERKTIEVDENLVDVIIIKQKAEGVQKKWNIVAGGNGEGILAHYRHDILTGELGGNAIYFDYSGLYTRSKLIKAARAVMRYVESEGAEQITAIGASLGGGILREAYNHHHVDKAKSPNARYAFIGDRTFSNIFDVVKTNMHPILAYLVHFFNWNLASSITNKFEYELAIQDETDSVIQRGAWLSDQGIVTSRYGHVTPVCGKYSEIVSSINTFFLSKKVA